MGELGEVCPCGMTPRSDPARCDLCWDSRASAEQVLELVSLVRQGHARARLMLGEVGDPGAAPVLRQLLGDDDVDVRAAATRSLGWSGGLGDVPRLLGLLDDPSERVREQAVRSLAELGGDGALDGLWALVEGGHPATPWAVEGLAAWRDPRVLPLIRTHLREGADGDRQLWNLLLGYGDPADLAAREEQLLQGALARSGPPSAGVYVWHDVAGLYPQGRRQEVFDRFRAWAVDNLPECVDLLDQHDPSRSVERLEQSFAPTGADESAGDRQVLVWSHEPPTDTGVSVARFGGQPEWAGPPTWPLADGGVPMAFYGQLPLPDGRTALVFVAADGESWDPLAGHNACVVQPGAPPDTAWSAQATGPQQFQVVPEQRPVGLRHRVRRLPAPSRFARLVPEAEAEADLGTALTREEARWNHVGGPPTWLQGPQEPPGDGWRFAFQFTAATTGFELGDGAECYGFVTDDGRGAFLWQCR